MADTHDTRARDGRSFDDIRRSIAALPEYWHGAGTVPESVLDALVRHTAGLDLRHTMETGAGRTSLLLSHLSERHVVFVIDDDGPGDSTLRRVRESPLLRAERVEFVIGPTQVTLRDHVFAEPLQLAYLDGPHAFPFPELEYYAVYPHLEPGGLLVVDDIQIPTIDHLFRFLSEDHMFELLEVVATTAFFARTESETLSPTGDGWWTQAYNMRHYPATRASVPERLGRRARGLARRALRR
jgi:hypothetical protein